MGIKKSWNNLQSALRTYGALSVGWGIIRDIWPILAGLGVGVPAWFNPDVPWYLAIMFFGITGAAFAAWRNQRLVYRLHGTPEHKLVISGASLVPVVDGSDLYQLVIELQNNSDFYLRVETDRTQCKIDGDSGKDISATIGHETRIPPRGAAGMNLKAYPVKKELGKIQTGELAVVSQFEISFFL